MSSIVNYSIHHPKELLNLHVGISFSYDDPYSEHDDKIVKEYMRRDGGKIPILQMTYIKKVNLR